MEDTIKSVLEALDLLEIADPSDRRFIGAVRGLIEGLAEENRALKAILGTAGGLLLGHHREQPTEFTLAVLQACQRAGADGFAELKLFPTPAAPTAVEPQARIAALEAENARLRRELKNAAAIIDARETEIESLFERLRAAPVAPETPPVFQSRWFSATLPSFYVLGGVTVEHRECLGRMFWRLTVTEPGSACRPPEPLDSVEREIAAAEPIWNTAAGRRLIEMAYLYAWGAASEDRAAFRAIFAGSLPPFTWDGHRFFWPHPVTPG